MPLGLAKDSMLNLADLAKKVEDGEYKTSFEYENDDSSEKVIRLSTGKMSDSSSHATDGEEDGLQVNGNSMQRLQHWDSQTSDHMLSPVSPNHYEMKTEDPDNSMDDKASVASSLASELSLSASETHRVDHTNYGKYNGFSNSEYDYYEDYYTAYAGKGAAPTLLGGNNNQKQGFWCCLFPWTGAGRMIAAEEKELSQVPGKESLVTVATESHEVARNGTARDDDDDETSTGSGMFGERLSQKDRQAVLARLRLAQPDTAVTSAPSTGTDASKPQEKGLLNGVHIPSETDIEEMSAPRGILKRPSKLVINSLSKEQLNGDTARRRSLFPAYAESSKEKKNLTLSFSPMARVLAVKSLNDMDNSEKGGVWWQKSDYEEFRKTGRMITKAMLAGGSEIWLATNRSWQLPNQARSTTLKHATSLAERQAAKKKGTVSARKEYENTRDKWWHKFGHSRRGLEHIASIDEGRQRQVNVRNAIRAVVEENRRQKTFLREDAEKLRMVSIRHSSWAKDLAIAAGASDANAVQMNFNEESRKSREFYLLKFSRANQANASKSAATAIQKKGTAVPAFMRPAMSLSVKANILDANTISQIRYRGRKAKVAPTLSSPSHSSASLHKSSSEQSSSLNKQRKETTLEKNSMAKKAAGFAKGEEVANMSAVLTGMGPLPKSVTTVGGP